MGVLATRAEIIKLSRELAISADDLQFFTGHSASELRALRSAVTEALDAPHRPMFARLGKVVQMLPSALVAKIAVWFFPPMLCGMVASEIKAHKATDIIGQLPEHYVAEAAQFVDPVRAESMIRGLPNDVLMKVTRQILDRGDHVTVGRFVSTVTDDQLRAVIGVVDSGNDVLMTGFFAEATDRFAFALAQLPDSLVSAVVRTAVDSGRVSEALTLTEGLDDAGLRRIANASARLGGAALTSVIESAGDNNAWIEAMHVLSAMDDQGKQVVGGLSVWTDARLRDSVAACTAAGLSEQVDTFAAYLPAGRQAFVETLRARS